MPHAGSFRFMGREPPKTTLIYLSYYLVLCLILKSFAAFFKLASDLLYRVRVCVLCIYSFEDPLGQAIPQNICSLPLLHMKGSRQGAQKKIVTLEQKVIKLEKSLKKNT